ncbi:FAD dependent oxidoreductase [Synechococcus elongatus PCC 7943]|uniref:FAD-dependent oxidoreductase n=1 Tax=Synechococcus elongatus TaxID=32046 RepID=UPI002052B376|nr:FAD-dependent oxidoreductase [Synechococcus elongatus]UOW69826.1 FAD dependent oxidoreductase [Synechococcus elongatus PCC 7943]
MGRAIGLWIGSIGLAVSLGSAAIANAATQSTLTCEILVVGGGLSGVAAAEAGLLAGRTVCLTEITDWLGGQVSSQGTSALDEAGLQQTLQVYPQGYQRFRDRLRQFYGRENPGDCWVSQICFLPRDAAQLLEAQLREAEQRGQGKLHWLPNTVVKSLQFDRDRRWIESVTAIQHRPATGAPPLNTLPLSAWIEDAYRLEDSKLLEKNVLQLQPPAGQPQRWLVIEATETGELLPLADVPYRLGLDPRSPGNPSSPVTQPDPYCTQGFTYTFAMEQTPEAYQPERPAFYDRYAPYFSYELSRFANPDTLFTYRRIWAPQPRSPQLQPGRNVTLPQPGDWSMQNWTWGNDYRPGTSGDNLILSAEQLRASGQLELGSWLGGLRTETLQRGEEHALSFFYWLSQGNTDSQLGPNVKQPFPFYRLLQGIDQPMGTANGLSKYPYIREGRRLIGRSSPTYPQGFSLVETDIARPDYTDPLYQETLSPQDYAALRQRLAREAILQRNSEASLPIVPRPRLFPDSVGITQYALDFHPCLTQSPPEKPGNTERAGVRLPQGLAYPGQIPLRAMIPQRVDNLLVTGKAIAFSYSVAAAYRVHSFEWSSGVAAGTVADFVLQQKITPAELVDDLPRQEPQLEALQRRLVNAGNPIAFPGTTLLDRNWLRP